MISFQATPLMRMVSTAQKDALTKISKQFLALTCKRGKIYENDDTP